MKKKLFVLLFAVVMVFALTACGGGSGGDGGSDADVTEEKGIISLDLAGDFLHDEEYVVPDTALAGIGLYCDSESEYHTNSFRPAFLVGTTTYLPENYVDGEVQTFHSYVYAENKQVEDITVGGMEGKMATYEEKGEMRKMIAVVGEPDDYGEALTLQIIVSSGNYPMAADEDVMTIVNSVKVDQDAAKEAMESEE